MAVTATALTRADLTPAVNELVDEIVNGDDSNWQDYATRIAEETAAGFKVGLFTPWSMNNHFYLAAQVKRRNAAVHGMYAGVAQWRLRNRVVRDDEVPFVIFGPPGFLAKPTVQAIATALAAGAPAPEPEMRGCRAPVFRVYDYTQTISTDPDYVEPDWLAPLAGGDLGTLAQLTAVSPVPVKFIEMGAAVEHGWLDKTGITVDSSRTVAEQIWTLAHELGHFHLKHLDLLESTSTTGTKADIADLRATCEQEAAMVQFLTMKMLGMDEAAGVNLTIAAGQYLRHWTKSNPDGTTTELAGHKSRRKLILKRFDVAYRVAQGIVADYAKLDVLVPAAA